MSELAISVIIPVHNEEAILKAAVVDLRESLLGLGKSFEIVLAENGSRDATLRLASKLSVKYPEVRYFAIGEANYGAALRAGIERARGELVICEEIDLCDADFHERAVAILERDEADMVVGSKLLPGARDQRPLVRHAASLAYSRALQLVLGFRGSDTHGLKAFRRERLLPVVARCLVDKDVFASELVIRADRMGLRLREIPVQVIEKRTPSINLVRRVPGVVRRVGTLYRALRAGGEDG